jgi:hypothetical protein
MLNDHLLDLYGSDDGDISIGHNGDLLVARDEDVARQEAVFRLKTQKGDWVLESRCGASLEELVGLPNTEETGIDLEERIVEALTHDALFTGNLGDLIVAPVNRTQILALVPINYGDEEFAVNVTLDLKEGVLA